MNDDWSIRNDGVTVRAPKLRQSEIADERMNASKPGDGAPAQNQHTDGQNRRSRVEQVDGLRLRQSAQVHHRLVDREVGFDCLTHGKTPNDLANIFLKPTANFFTRARGRLLPLECAGVEGEASGVTRRASSETPQYRQLAANF